MYFAAKAVHLVVPYLSFVFEYVIAVCVHHQLCPLPWGVSLLCISA